MLTRLTWTLWGVIFTRDGFVKKIFPVCFICKDRRSTRITNGKPQIDHVEEPSRDLSFVTFPLRVESDLRFFPQLYLLLLVTLVSISLRLFPKVTVKERSHCTWSRRRLDSLGLSGGFSSLKMVL